MYAPWEFAECPQCRGEGVLNPDICEECPYFDGDGCEVIDNPSLCLYDNICPYCQGSGEVPEDDVKKWYTEL